MTKRSRYSLFTLVVVIGVVLGITPAVIHFLAERELGRLQQRGMKVQAAGISGFLIGLAAESIETWLPFTVPGMRGASLPIQLRAESTYASIRPQVFPPGLAVYTQSSVYGGILRGSVSKLVYQPAFSGDLLGVDISLHPQLRALGVEAGSLDISLENLPLSRGVAGTASAQVHLRGLEVLPPEALRKVIGISTLSNGDVSASVVIRDQKSVYVESCSFDSSLASGRLSGSASILPSGKLNGIDASLTVKLNRKDSSKLSPWLPLITNQMVASTSPGFVCDIQSTDCRDARSIKTGLGCLKVSCQ